VLKTALKKAELASGKLVLTNCSNCGSVMTTVLKALNAKRNPSSLLSTPSGNLLSPIVADHYIHAFSEMTSQKFPAREIENKVFVHCRAIQIPVVRGSTDVLDVRRLKDRSTLLSQAIKRLKTSTICHLSEINILFLESTSIVPFISGFGNLGRTVVRNLETVVWPFETWAEVSRSGP